MVKILNSILILTALISCSDHRKNKQEENIKSDVQLLLEDPQLIPLPLSSKSNFDYFSITDETSLHFSPELRNEGKYLKHLLEEKLTFSLKNTSLDTTTAQIRLTIDKNALDSLQHAEAYALTINSNGITITGNTNEGVMRGIQTLRQLVHPNFYENDELEELKFAGITIQDEPAFSHRGMLLDVCRHFFEKDVVLKYIDALAYYKMNILHFHLTEDQGWRIPIEKYPLLTEVGAWRTEENGERYGGHYTKEELKEIVAYAETRHITVIPEIELPGHAQAALAAYPEYSCTGGPFEVANDWGVFKEIYCAGNDSTFAFIEDILTEVMEIFPSEYIHIGGDEAPKFRWEHCEKCQNRMKKEGLKDAHELQSYFIQRIEGFLNDKGRKLIGWDEILEGGLSDNATVQSWRGFEGGIEAAKEQHEVIMSPTSHCYLDYGLHTIDLEKIYSFDPIPEELPEELHPFIIGGECNMWTEHVPDEENLDTKVFPRMIGLAEVLWRYDSERTFEDFYQRLQTHYPILSEMGIAYGQETIGAALSVLTKENGNYVQLEKNLPDLRLEYFWDDEQSKTYANDQEETPLIPIDRSGTFSVQAYKGDTPYGEPITQRMEQHLGFNAHITYETTFNEWYDGNGPYHLVDGQVGSLDFRDGNWQGFWGTDAILAVELEKPIDIKEINIPFYQYANAWILAPRSVEIKVSTDGTTWNTLPTQTRETVDLTNEKQIIPYQWEDLNLKGIQHLHINIENVGKVPEGHEAAGSDAWIFIDELIIR